jgi:hypothetical protein
VGKGLAYSTFMQTTFNLKELAWEPPFATSVPSNKLDNYKGFQYGGTIRRQKPINLGTTMGRKEVDAHNELVILLW